MASELVTTEELSNYLNDRDAATPENDLIRLGVHAFIENYCNLVFAADATDRAETHRIRYDYQDAILLKKPPVISFTSLQTGESGDTPSTVDSTSYEYDSDTGIVRMISTFFTVRILYTANYKGGYSSIPEDIKQTALSIMAREIEKASKGRHGMRGRAVQATSVELFQLNLEPFEKMILDQYRIMRMD